MKRQPLTGAIVITLLALSMAWPASATLNSDGDFQFFNNESFEGKFNDRWKAGAEVEFWVGDSASKLYKQEDYVELIYKVNDWLDLSGGYRQVFVLDTKLAPEAWFTEYRPTFNATLKYKWEGWDLSDRNRFEYRMFDRTDKEDKFSYRNKLTIKSPWKWTRFNINPFVADEIFVQENDDLWRNRLYAGMGFDLVKHVSASLFYLLESNKTGDNWNDLNILGTQLKFSF